MSAKRVTKKLESRHAKKMAPHMWVIFKRPMGGYGVSIGDPRLPSSTLKAVLPSRRDLEEWVRENVGHKISADHILDKSGLGLVSPDYSDFYTLHVLPKIRSGGSTTY